MGVRYYIVLSMVTSCFITIACSRKPSIDRIAGARYEIEWSLERSEALENAGLPSAQYSARNLRRALRMLEGKNSGDDIPATPYHVVLLDRRRTNYHVPERSIDILSLESGDRTAGFYLTFPDQRTHEFQLPKRLDEGWLDAVRYTLLRDRFVFIIENGKERKEDFPDLEGAEWVEMSPEVVERLYSGEWFSLGLLLDDGSRSDAVRARFFPEEEAEQGVSMSPAETES